MALSAGNRVGPYEIAGPIGAGGMGEVYRARDTRLDRDVAIKVLPDLFLHDPERLARFEREAKTLASLNHPHIAHIYGIEPFGDGARALVMELVEGENLAQRIAGGAIPLDEALTIARRIAGALEAAHERGIVHRDLKPANVMITPDGDVKVLDFGLAKAGDAPGAQSGDFMNSPTITSPATQVGTILGTAAYMSPEQAKGRAADRRSDVWALGCVLFEMLSGRRAFDGEDLSDTLALVLRGDPDWTALPPSTPAALTSVIRQCLTKDRHTRIPDPSVVRFLLDLTPPAAAVPQARASRAARLARLAAAAAVGAAIVAAAGWPLLNRADAPRVQFDFPFDNAGAAMPALAVSPDGRMIAYTGWRGAGVPPVMFVRALDSTQPRVLEGTDGVMNLFWSPDSKFIGFIARGRVRTIPAAGGPPQDLANAIGTSGGSWSEQGDIIYSSGALTGASLHRVPAAGGESSEVLKPDAVHTALRAPVFLPGGRRFLYLAWSADPAKRAIYAGSLDGEAPVLITPSESQPLYVDPGFLLYHRAGTILAQRFDAGRLRLSGEPMRVMDGARFSTITGRVALASTAGVLAVVTGLSREPDRTLAWIGRDGRTLGTVGEPGPYDQVRLSPDETKAVIALPDSRSSQMTLAVMDLATRILMPLPLPDGGNDPVWSPDSKTLMFESLISGKRDFFTHIVGGQGTTLAYESPDDPKWLDDWSRDGRYVLFHRPQPGKLYAIDLTAPAGSRAPTLLTEHSGNLDGAHFSPDGKWIAYTSDESGVYEVWIASFPAFDQRRRVSLRGGGQPFWRGDGRELFYLSLDGQMMSSAVAPGSTPGSILVRAPELLFRSPLALASPGLDQYSVTKDGQRFLFIVPGKSRSETPPSITVTLNWTSGLR